MNEKYETQLRVALDARAHEIELPDGLADRTLDAVRTLRRETWRERVRARRDSRAPVTGYPRWTYAVGAVAAVVMLFAVGSFAVRPGEGAKQNIAGQVHGSIDTASESGAASSGTVALTGAPPPNAPLPPKIKKSADIDVQVGNFDKAWASANDIAARHGGYITDSTTTQTGSHVGSGTVTMHVPVNHLDATLKDLRRLGTLVQLSTTGQDVSAPIADLAARRKAAEAEETRLLELMNEAGSLDAVDSIRQQLNSTRSEVEKIKAQEASYQHDVDFATVNATIEENAAAPNGTFLGSYTLGKAVRTARHVAATVVAGTIVVVAGLLPLALLALLIWLVVRVVRRRAL